jgi:hypothetical protein
LSHQTSRGTQPKKVKAATMPARMASVRSVVVQRYVRLAVDRL